jgi:hypothetical protein
VSKVIPILPGTGPDRSNDAMLVMLRVSDLRALIRSELSATDTGPEPDRLVDIGEAAKLLSVSEDYLYHNLKRLPSCASSGRGSCGSASTGYKSGWRRRLDMETAGQEAVGHDAAGAWEALGVHWNSGRNGHQIRRGDRQREEGVAVLGVAA